MRDRTLDQAHFEQLYRVDSDPWRFASSPYERAKYAATLAALPRARYRAGLDVGCSIGVLTEALAARCDDLLGIEPVRSPVFVPAQWPDGSFDLIVVSEVVDYLGAADLAGLGGRIAASLHPGGDLVLVHWVGKKAGRPTGREASDRLIAALAGACEVTRAERNPDYRLDVLRRR